MSSHASTSQYSSQNIINVSQTGLNSTVNEIVVFLLNVHKSLKPVKKSTITKYFKGISGKNFIDVMAKVKTILDDIFGIKLVETPDKTSSYILVNGLPPEITHLYEKKEFNWGLCHEEMALLYIISTVIDRNGGRMLEDQLLTFLHESQIINLGKKTNALGIFEEIDVESFLKQITSYLYLNSEVIYMVGNENNLVFYSWGLRAQQEVPKETIDEYFLDIDSVNLRVKPENDSDVEVFDD